MFTEKRSGVSFLFFSPPQIFIETTETQLTQSMLHLNSRTPVLTSSRPQCVLDSSNSRGQTCQSELPRRQVLSYQVRVLINGHRHVPIKTTHLILIASKAAETTHLLLFTVLELFIYHTPFSLSPVYYNTRI